MKQHLSVLMLIARSSIYKVIALLAAMAAVQAGLFHYTLKSGTQHLETIISDSGLTWVFVAVFLILTWILSRTGCKRGSQPGYTLQRLRISERAVFLWQTLYNTAIYALLLTAEILLIYALGRIWLTQADPQLIGAQSLYLAFYRSSFLHCLCPLDETWLWIRNAILTIAMGMASAQYPFRQWRGKTVQVVLTMAAAVTAFFVRDMGVQVYDVFGVGFALIVICLALYRVFGGETDDEEN